MQRLSDWKHVYKDWVGTSSGTTSHSFIHKFLFQLDSVLYMINRPTSTLIRFSMFFPSPIHIISDSNMPIGIMVRTDLLNNFRSNTVDVHVL